MCRVSIEWYMEIPWLLRNWKKDVCFYNVCPSNVNTGSKTTIYMGDRSKDTGLEFNRKSR